MGLRVFLSWRPPLVLIAAIAIVVNLSATMQELADGQKLPHLVSFVSGDVTAEPQVLHGTVSRGKAELSGTFRATYNFEKWIANTNQGDSAVYEILRAAQVAAGGVLTGNALFKVDANAVVNSFITVVVEVGSESYTIKLYTCVDHRKTTVTEDEAEIVVSQVEGTAAAYRAPLCAWSNEGEDLVYKIKK